MKDLEVSRNITMPVKCLIVAMLSLIFIVTLIPLWQIGSRSTSEAEMIIKADMTDVDREGRALRAAVAAGLPEAEGEFLLSASI